MRRSVIIEDPTLGVLAQTLYGAISQLENIAQELKRHQHFTNDPDSDEGGKWSAQSDAFRFLNFDDVANSLASLKDDLGDILADDEPDRGSQS